MMRRFVNLLSHKWCGTGKVSSSIYSLHRIDVADHLFYPSTADAEKAKAVVAIKEDGGEVSWPPGIQRLRQLPASTMTFQAVSRGFLDSAFIRFFELLSTPNSEGRMVFSNKLGHSVLYDADANCVTAMPVLAGKLGCAPITISVTRPVTNPELQPNPDLYVMHSRYAATADKETCRFGVLRDHRHHEGTEAWSWDPLPAPPLGQGKGTSICSHAVVDGGHAICVSARSVTGHGPSRVTEVTCWFDTVKREWKHAGDWMLPFLGGCVHVPAPALGDLWLGFTDDDRLDLCAASGLSAAMDKAPALLHIWRDIGKVPGNWRPMNFRLLDLGGGKFCIAKEYCILPDTEYNEYYKVEIDAVVLSGVELLTGGRDRPSGSIHLVEHKSLGYLCSSEGEESIHSMV